MFSAFSSVFSLSSLVIHLKVCYFLSMSPTTFKILQHQQTLLLMESGLKLVLEFSSKICWQISLKSIQVGALNSKYLTLAAKKLKEVASFFRPSFGHFFEGFSSKPYHMYVPFDILFMNPQPSRIFMRSQMRLCLTPVAYTNSLAQNWQSSLWPILSMKTLQRSSMENLPSYFALLSLSTSCCRMMGWMGVFGVKIYLQWNGSTLAALSSWCSESGLLYLFMALCAILEFNLYQCCVGISFQIMVNQNGGKKGEGFYFLGGWGDREFGYSLLDGNRILYHRLMLYAQAGKGYTSSHNASWFQGEGLEGYKVPQTVTGQYFGVVGPSQKENIGDLNYQKQQGSPKGHRFEKAPRLNLFQDKRTNPAPNYYFKAATETSENQGKGKSHESPFFRKYPRFQQKSSYFDIPYMQKNESPKKKTLANAEVVGFLDYARLKSTWTPGPGAYDVKVNRHKSLSHFSKSKKNSFPDIHEKKGKDRKKGIGPETYMIPRSLSMACSVKFKQPLKEFDSRIKEGINRVNVSKEKTSKAGPGKYLKIEDWCKYKNSRKVMNGLDVCSKPVNQLKIYT